jgi:LEA14-like dessication related protein
MTMAIAIPRRRFLSLAGAAALAGCATGDPLLPPQVRLADIAFQEAGLLEQRFQVDLRLGNPNDTALAIDGLTFKLEVNGVALAEGLSDHSVTIPRLDEAKVPVTTTTTVFDVVRQILALQNREAVAYRITGLVYLDGFARRSVPYEMSGVLQLRPVDPGADTLVPI